MFLLRKVKDPKRQNRRYLYAISVNRWKRQGLLRDMRIGTRLMIGFGGVLLLFSLAAVMIYYAFNQVQRDIRLVQERSLPTTLLVEEMTHQTLQVMELMLYASTTRRTEGFRKADRVADEFKINLKRVSGLARIHGDEHLLETIADLEKAFDHYYEQGRDMAFVYFTEGTEEGNHLVDGFEHASADLRGQINQLKDHEVFRSLAAMDRIKIASHRLMRVILTLSSIAIVFGVLIAGWIIRSIAIPLQRAVEFSNAVALGDYNRRVGYRSRNEIGQLIYSLDMMADGLAAKASVAAAIAAENLDVSVSVASHHDLLGRSLKEMVASIRKMVRELEDAKTEAEKANAAITQFLANISHEIRTPMNAILGFSELLYEGENRNDSKSKSHLAAIISSGNTLLSLINDILDLSKIVAGRMEADYQPVAPLAVLNDIRKIFEIQVAEKGLLFDVTLDPDLPREMMLDEVRIRQVLFNLVGNAVKFTSAGAIRLHLRVIRKYSDNRRLDLEISVEDTGEGIPADQQEVVFKPFRQQKSQSVMKYGGTGLGLSICKGLVELMNGDIHLESRLGEGSCFSVVLRDVAYLEGPGNVTEIKTESPFEGLHFAPGHVLVVDDVKENRDLLKGYLARVGLDWYEAANGHEAVIQAAEHHPDLILMDLKMPEMTGYEAISLLREDPNTVKIPIIAVSAAEIDVSEKPAAWTALLKKPINSHELMAHLAAYLPLREPVKRPLTGFGTAENA